ncbi:MAG: pilin [Candidatus Paceibacterota bacterium]
MKKVFFVIFLGVLSVSFFFLSNGPVSAATNMPDICNAGFTDSQGESYSADDWCTDCPDGPYDFCNAGIQYHFSCISDGLFGMYCSCDHNSAWYESCSGNCTNWNCTKGASCSGGSCGGGSACPSGQISPHRVCQSGQCVEVAGCGVETCQSNSTCASTNKTISNVTLSPSKTSYNAGESVSISWSSTNFIYGLNYFIVQLLDSGGSMVKEYSPYPLSPASWNIPSDVPAGTYTFRVCEMVSGGSCGTVRSNSASFSIQEVGGGCPSGQMKPHKECSGTSCIQVDTCGTSQCNDDSNCTSGGGCPSGQMKPHKECSGTSCIQVDTCGTSQCNDDSNCTSGGGCPTGQVKPHKECSGSTCFSVSSCGVNLCNTDTECGGGGGGGGPVEIQNPIKAGSFEDIIGNIINFIFKIAIVLVPLLVIVAGFFFVTSAGDVKKVTQAKSILIYTAVGLFIVLLSKGILAIIKQILGTS